MRTVRMLAVGAFVAALAACGREGRGAPDGGDSQMGPDWEGAVDAVASVVDGAGSELAADTGPAADAATGPDALLDGGVGPDGTAADADAQVSPSADSQMGPDWDNPVDSDGSGASDAKPADAVPAIGNLYVTLQWTTPGDPDPSDKQGADLNLHLAQAQAAGPVDLDCDGAPDPWYDPALDCNWFNPTPDWGKPGVATDDPIHVDATTAGNPETIDVPSLEPGEYLLGVHGFDAKGLGGSTVKLTLFWSGALALQIEGVPIGQSDLWHVARLQIAADGTLQVGTCHQSGDACLLAQDPQAPGAGKWWQAAGDWCTTPCYEYKGLYGQPTPGCEAKWP